METSEKAVQIPDIQSITRCFATHVSNIRTELKLFNAILHVKNSPLRTLILSPLSYKEPIIPSKSSNYTGYVSISTWSE